jgi:hypothetical protein
MTATASGGGGPGGRRRWRAAAALVSGGGRIGYARRLPLVKFAPHTIRVRFFAELFAG